MHLCMEKHLSVAAIKGHHSTLVSVFKYHLLELLDSFILRDLIRSFEIKRPRRPVGSPSWDLVKVLTYLRGSTFEPLTSKPLCLVTVKLVVLLALVTSKRVGELHALSCRMASHGPDISLAYLPVFVAKTEFERDSFSHSFLVHSLENFVEDLPEERLLSGLSGLIW